VSTRQPAPGFELLRSSPFVERLGPIYLKSGPGGPVFGAVVEHGHTNTMGTAHGGFLAALVDLATGRGTRLVLGEATTVRTVSVNLDFVAGVQVGSWIEAAVTVEHNGGRTVFTACRITADGTLVARANVILTKA
jgi:uncharacterized protein (TIGR00369 family)